MFEIQLTKALGGPCELVATVSVPAAQPVQHARSLVFRCTVPLLQPLQTFSCERHVTGSAPQYRSSRTHTESFEALRPWTTQTQPLEQAVSQCPRRRVRN